MARHPVRPGEQLPTVGAGPPRTDMVTLNVPHELAICQLFIALPPAALQLPPSRPLFVTVVSGEVIDDTRDRRLGELRATSALCGEWLR